MIRIYTDNKLIVAKREIITSVTDVEKALITLKENPKKNMDRRQFMLFSAVLSATMVFPTKSEAWIWFLIRPALTFLFRREVRKRIIRSTGGNLIKHGGKTALNMSKNYKDYSSKQKKVEVKKIKDTFEAKLGLTLDPTSLLHSANMVSNGETKIIWDREGYHEASNKEIFSNIAFLEIRNKTNKNIETQIKLALLNGQKEQSFKRRYTLKASPNARAKVDVSHIYRGLPKTGIQYIIYELETHKKDIQISSPNKKVYVTKLFT